MLGCIRPPAKGQLGAESRCPQPSSPPASKPSHHIHCDNEDNDMQWLSENWVWVLIGVAFLAMHMFGHGGHGGHGGSGGGGRKTSQHGRATCRERGCK